MEETEKFHKRAGTTDKGKEYENVVIGSVVVQLVKNATINNFHISSNDKNFGAFDDIVIKLESDKGTEIKAIQLKHSDRKTLSTENLKSKKGDYSISKYFESFQEIGNVADEFIMFTNRPFHADEDTKFQLEGEGFYIKLLKVLRPSDSLAMSKDVNHFYKFQIIEDEWCIQNPSKFQEYTTFFNKFHLYTNQENLHVLRNTTAENFKKAFYSNEEIFDKFIKIISEWNMQEGKKDKLNKQWMQGVIALQLLSSQIEPLSFGLVNDKMKIFRDGISSFDITLFEEKSCETVKQLWSDIAKENINKEELNRVGRNYQLSTRYVNGNNMDNLNSKEFTQMLWLMNKCPLIVHECENVENAIQLCPDKKFILLGESTNMEWMKNYIVFQNLSNLKLKLNLRKKLIKNFTISIQEKKEISLMTVYKSHENFLENVTTDNLLEMLNGPYKLGGIKESLPEPYIERYLSQNIINSTYLQQVRENTVIVLNCGDNFDKVKDKLNYYTIIDIEKLSGNSEVVENAPKNEFPTDNSAGTIYVIKENCSDSELQQIFDTNSKAENIHYFKIMDDGNLEWIKSKGDVNNLQIYKLLSNKYFTNENALWSSQLNSNINLITGDPGMGKTELMKSFKNKCLPKFWTIIINPKDVNSFFKKNQLSKNSNYTDLFENFIINEKYPSLTKLDQTILEMFLQNNNILYVWDALDEILSEYLHTTSDLILDFSKKGFIQWVTSRQHLKTFLENKLNVFSYSINQFTEHEQQDYIRKRLTAFISVDEIETTIQKIKSTFVIVEHVDILGIPLQVFMLTELFRRDNDKYLNLLNNTFLLTDLYHYFIEEKFNIFYKDKMGFDLQNPHMTNIITKKTQEASNDFAKLALNMIFPEKILQRLDIDSQKHTQKVFQMYASLGLLNKVQNNVINFLHGSFAEYFVASYFSKNFNNILVDVIFDAKYNNVRFFFDMLMAKDSPAHIAVLYKNFDLLQTYDDETLRTKDAGGRSALHLICSWGQRHPRVHIQRKKGKFIVDDSNSFNSKPESKEYFQAVMFLQSKNRFDQFDTLLDMTPLSYAKKSESLGAELKLLQIQNFELNKSSNFNDRINILYYSTLLGYDEVSELFPAQKSNNVSKEVKFVTGRKGLTSLLLACENNCLNLVQYLVKCGAEINRTDHYGWTPLFVACSNGHIEIVKYLVKTGAKINECDNTGLTPLYVAAENNHENVVEYLAEAGVEINHANKDGVTPLYVATENGHETIIKYLVRAGTDINCATNDGATPLYVATKNGHEKTVEYLVEAGAKINLVHNNGRTPLHIACLNGYDKIVKHLVRADAAAEINRSSRTGCTPLYEAAFNGHKKTVKYLLQVGAEINRAVRYGCTPLYVASFNGHEKTVECLVKAGAEINRATIHGWTPLHAAAQNGYARIVEYLMTARAQINFAGKNGLTPLHAASFNNHGAIVECLVKAGAEINHVTNDGWTPLYVASQHSHEKTVEYLVKAGAEINRADKYGSTPLYVACYKGHEKTVEYLVEAGAEINTATIDGWTPLHAASQNGCESILEYLVKAGAEINFAGNNGVTPLHAACFNGHQTVVEYLIKAGAEINRPTNDGWTPLHAASQNGHETTVKYLVKRGGELDLCDYNGRTPLYAASVNGHNETVEYLMEARAMKNRKQMVRNRYSYK